MQTMMRKCDVTSVRAVICDTEPDYTSPYYEVLEIALTPTTTYQTAYHALKDQFHASEGWFDMGGAGTLVEDALRVPFGATVVGDVNAIMPQARNGDTTLYVGLIPLGDDTE